jgi:PKD repeat protein
MRRRLLDRQPFHPGEAVRRLQRRSHVLKTLHLLALVPLVVGCHFDKLFSGGGNGPPLSHGTPVALAFNAAPEQAHAGQPLDPVVVAVVDSTGTPVAGADNLVTISLAGGATLSGTDTAHAVNGAATFRNLRIDQPGNYKLTASGAGLDPDTSRAFDVMPPPTTTGDLKVNTSTTGGTPDPDGYTVTVDGSASQPIIPTGSVTFIGLTSGNHTVELSGIAGNCTVSGGPSRTVNVPANATRTEVFTVSCPTPPPTTGSLAVTTSTSGPSQDPDGYTVTVDGDASRPIGLNQTVTFTDLSVASHTAVLSGIAANCTVSGGTSRTVDVTAGNTATASFSVSCPTPVPTTGDLTVTTTTGGTGGLDTDGYTLTVDGTSQSIGTNDSRTLSGLSAGDHSVGLSGVAGTCVVSGQNPRTVNVPAGGANQANFAITCTAPANEPPTADFSSNCNGLTCAFTSTSSDPDGSIASYEWTFGDGGTSTGQNPSRTYGGTGNYTVTLTVRDNQGATAGASHVVHVEAPPPPPTQPPIVNAGGDERVLLGLGYTLDGASFTDPDHDGDWTVTINWGDGASTTFTTSSEGSISSRSHTYVLGTFTIRVTVRDSHGNSAFDEKELKVLLIL